MDDEKVITGEETRSLTFRDILFILRKHWIALVVFIFLGTAAGFTWTKVQEHLSPVYKSTGIIMVSTETSSGQSPVSGDYTLANNLTNTVVAFIKTNAVLDGVREVEPSFKSSKLSVSNTTGNLMIKVSYSSSDPEESQKMVDLVMDCAITEANRLSDQKDKDDNYKPVYHMLNDNLNIVDRAKKGVQTTHTLRNTALGLGAGVVVGAAYVFIRELLDNTFKSSEEIERLLNVPVLAGIPDYHFDDEKKGKESK